MGKRQPFGIAGSILLFFGVFAPIVRVPTIGNINYFRFEKGYATIICILAAISLFLTIKNKRKWLYFTGIASFSIVAITFMHFYMKSLDTTINIERKLSWNPFHGFTDISMDNIRFQWGLAILITGSVFIILSAMMKAMKNNTITLDNKILCIYEKQIMKNI